MRQEKMLKYMNLLDDKYILEAAPKGVGASKKRKNKRISNKFLRYGALAASLVIVIGIGLLIPHLKFDAPVTPLASGGEDTSFIRQPVGPDTHTTIKPPERVDGNELDDKIENFDNAIGGSSTFFVRKYVDETYNIAYLSAVYRDEPGVVSREDLDNWVNNVYLKQESEQQSEFPTMYQAIHYFSISKEELININESRKERGSEMILPDEIIDALFLSEDEMKKELVHPCALYYDGEIYTWEDLKSTSFDEKEGVPGYIVDNYIDNLIVYCVENEIIPEGHISRYFELEE